MKNFNLRFAGLLVASGPAFLGAQPVLTATGINPVPGDQLTLHSAQYAAPGNAGVNQTWNLAFTSSGPSTVNVVATSSTPSAPFFPGSTVALQSGSFYQYYNTTSSAWQYCGFDDGNGIIAPFTDPEDVLHFPVNYGDAFTDSWSVTYNVATYDYYQWGTVTATADGWGTLTTPAGTFSNVMRVHFVETYRDSVYINNTPSVTNYVNDSYMWYLNGNHYQVATVYTNVASPGGTIQSGFYLGNVVSSTEEFNTLRALSVIPNPASDVLNFNYTLLQQADITISIHDATGRLVSELSQVPAYEGENTYVLSVADLPEGAYYATMVMEGNVTVTRKFIVTR